MRINIQSFDLHKVELRTRMPFRYGIATMTQVPQVFLRLRVDVDGQAAVGISSDCLPPKWFTKIPTKAVDEEIQEMVEVIQHAATTSAGMGGESAFAIWQKVYQAQLRWAATKNLPPLLANFGTSLVERALIEAIGRATGQAFSEMLQANTLGIELGRVHESLRGKSPPDFLPARPLSEIIVRHTVGLADPLTDDDVPPEERLDDGLPQSLAACIKAYGLRHFKIKVNGDLKRDEERLTRVAAVIREGAPRDYAFSLDGNEQFKSVAEFRAFWQSLQQGEGRKEFFGHLLFVEQPLHRDAALQPAVRDALDGWPQRPPLIIDESDGTLEDVPTALRLGYAGASHKNCKGVFKGIAHRCLMLQRQRDQPGSAALMSGEDLCTIGPVALLQDLAAMAALGISSVERNGHHYHAGLSQLPQKVQQQTLAHHPDLYHQSPRGWPTLSIGDGQVRLDSINPAPFGVGFLLDVSQFESTR